MIEYFIKIIKNEKAISNYVHLNDKFESYS